MVDLLNYHVPFTNSLFNIFPSTGFGFGTATATTVPAWANSSILHLPGDYNGDGLLDLGVFNNTTSKYYIHICKGSGFNAPIQSNVTPNSSANVLRQVTSDFNGDGISDMLMWNATTSRYDFYRAKGDGTFDAPLQTDLPSQTNQGARNMLGDFNGDGRTDMLVWRQPGDINRYFLYLSSGVQPDLVSKVTNGHGGSSEFEYKPLTDTTVYTKGTSLAYPFYTIQTAMHVVSKITNRNGVDGDAFTVQANPTLGTSSTTYHYEQGWMGLEGQGFRGFTAVEQTDVVTGIVSRTEYDNSSSQLAGHPIHTTQKLPDGHLIAETTNVWAYDEFPFTNSGHTEKSYFPRLNHSTSKEYETNQPIGSAAVRTTSVHDVTYDAFGNMLTTTTEHDGGFIETTTSTYVNDTTRWILGRLATSSVTKTGPNPAGSGTISLTRASSFAYHPTTGLLTQEVIEPNETTLRQQKDYTHDGFGNILTSTISTSGAASRTTTTTYTPDGRFVETTTNALNHTESKTYDPLLGNVLTQTGPNNLTSTWNYDAIGRPIQENRPDGTVTRSFYRRVTGSTVGAPPRAVHYVRVQSSGGAPKTVWYDLLDREIRTDGIAFDGRTVSSHKVFNHRGEVQYTSRPYFEGELPTTGLTPAQRDGFYSVMEYDEVGREKKQTDPGVRITTTAFNGLITTVTNPNNQTVSSTVNVMGWTISSTDAANKTITRKYDPYGNLRFVTDPANNTTELRYDLRGNKTWMSEPNSGTSSFTYNGFGELKTQTNNANQTVSLTYDKLGRVLTRTEPEGVTTFEYDSAAQGIGQLARESSGDFVRSYFYDHLSRPVSTVESHSFHSFAVSRSYDGYGRPDAMSYPTGLATRQVYTANGHLSEVQNAATTQLYWRALAVNARGQITQEVQGNGVVTERAFDADSGLIDGITSTFGAAGDVQKAEFDFDLIGNLTARRDKRYSTTFSETFGYDTLNRLKTVTTTGAAAVTAAYNDLGNITSRTDVGSFSYGAASTGPHALTGVTGGAFNKSCGYDAKGNRITDGATSLTYSSFNKPVRMIKGSDTLRFDYGPDRALYRQTTFLSQPGGATSQTVREYIGGLYERETTSEGLVRHIHYIAGGSGVAAILTDERSASTTAQRTRYIHKDHLGSVDVITDSAGAVVERQSFDAWGRRRTVAYNTGTSTWSVTYPATPGSAETHRGFTGHEMLDAVGLVHMGGRIYDPITARFLSPDPFVQSPDNLQNLNRYSYVLNNPLSFTDPSGFFFKGLGKWLKNNWKQVVSVAVGIAISFIVPGSWTVFAQGFAGGFGSAFSGTLLAGGSVGDALRAGLKGGAISGGTAYALGGLSDKYKWSGKDFDGYSGAKFAEKLSEKTIAHGFVGGTAEVIGGGKFVHGFMSSAAAAASSPIIYAQTHDISDALGVAAAATVGGTVSQLGGGKFANGAMSAAMGYMFNELGDHPDSYGNTPSDEGHSFQVEANDLKPYYGELVLNGKGNAECATLVQNLTGAWSSSTWFPGEQVQGNFDIPIGTAIGTFRNNKYPGASSGNHVGFYMGQVKDRLFIFEQYKSSPYGGSFNYRLFNNPSKNGTLTRDGSSYYVIRKK